MKLFLKAFLGGHSWIGLVALALTLGGVYLKYTHALDQAVKMEVERDAYKAESLGKDLTIQTLSRTQARRRATDKDLKDVQDIIANTENSAHCIASESVRASIEWLREYRARQANPNPD